VVRRAVRGAFQVSGNTAILDAVEDDARAGRSDDDPRARDLTGALADDDVAAILTVRGGAWLTRILPRIDFSVLHRRSRPVVVFGFSEITSLVNIVASYANGRGVLDMGPAFIPYGLRRALAARRDEDPPADSAVDVRREFAAWIDDVVSILTGAGSRRSCRIEAVRGPLPDGPCRFFGGNLAVLVTLLGGPFRETLAASARKRPDQEMRWLVLEDIYEPAYRLDRFLAMITLADVWPCFDGILLGDFHLGDADLFDAVLELLPFHLVRNPGIILARCRQVGHVWPMSPLLLGFPGNFRCVQGKEYRLDFDWKSFPIRQDYKETPRIGA